MIDIQKSVAIFAAEMEKKLLQNAWKGGWENCGLQYLSMRLTQEREEFRKAVKRGHPEDVLSEAADVANFAMMIADVVRWDKEREEREEPDDDDARTTA